MPIITLYWMRSRIVIIQIKLGRQFHLFAITLIYGVYHLIPDTMGTIIHFIKSLTQCFVERNNIW